MHAATAPNAQFERYHTFAFDPTAGSPDRYAESPPEVRARIEQTATTILKSHGYTPATGRKADFVVRIKTGRWPPSTDAAALPPVEQTEIPYSGFIDDEQRDLVEGSFVIDAFDAETHKLLWHGSARSVIDPARVDYDRLQRAVESVMAFLPARAAQ